MTGPRGRRCAGDAGIGLPELLVTMLLLGIVGSLVLALVTTTSGALSRERAATDSSTRAAVAMNELTRVIRAGTENPVDGQTLPDPVFTALGGEDVVLHAAIDTDATHPQPVLVRFTVTPQRELVETRWTATETVLDERSFWSFPAGGTPTVRVLARDVVSPGAGRPLFTFLRRDGTAILPLPAAPTAIELREVAAVAVNLTIQADPTGRARPVTLQNAVGIPNLGISRTGS